MCTYSVDLYLCGVCEGSSPLMFKRFDIHTLLIYGEHNRAGVILINMNTGNEAALYDVGWISYNDKYI